MTGNTPTLNPVEQQIIAYLNDHGPTACLQISADLDLDPFLALKTLWRLQDQGQTRFFRWTTLHELCPLQ